MELPWHTKKLGGYTNPSTWKARGRQKPHHIADLRQRLVAYRIPDMKHCRGIVLALLILDGLTWQEACCLTLDQIRSDLGIVFVSDQMSKPIGRDTLEAIDRYLEVRNQKGPCQSLLTTFNGIPLTIHHINISYHLRFFGRAAGIHHNLSISTVELSRD